MVAKAIIANTAIAANVTVVDNMGATNNIVVVTVVITKVDMGHVDITVIGTNTVIAVVTRGTTSVSATVGRVHR